MTDPGVSLHGPPLGSHKIVSAEDDSRMLDEEALLSNGLPLSNTDEDTQSLHSPHFNDLPSVTPRTDPQDDDGRIPAEEDASPSGFELPDESDSGVGPSSLDNANALSAIRESSSSSKRGPADEYFAVEAKVQKNHQIEYGLLDHWALAPQDVVAAPEQHTSLRSEHGVFAAQIPPSSNDLGPDEENSLVEMMRNLGNQHVNELPLVGDHKPATKTKPAEGANKANLPVANHADGIASDFNRIVQENHDKYVPTLHGLDFIGGNEYRFNLKKQLAAAKDGESSRGFDSSFASRGGKTPKRGGSPLHGGRQGGHIGSSRSRLDLGLGRRLSFDASENIPPPPPPTDSKLAEALALARSMKFNPAEGKSSRGRSTILSSVGRSASTTRATFVASKTKAPSPKKTAKRSRQASFNKDTSARLVVKSAAVKTMCNNDWLSNASSALDAKSASHPPSFSRRPNSAPPLSDTAHQSSAESVTRGSSDGADLLVQRAYNAPLAASLQSAQNWEDEQGPDNIYDTTPLPPAQLISLSPVRSAASEGALVELRELQDEDDLDWMSMPVLQPDLPPSCAATSSQAAADVSTLDDGNESSLLMDFGSSSRVAGQSSASPPSLPARHGDVSGSAMPLSLMDQFFAMDEELPRGRSIGEAVENIVAVAAVVSSDSRIRYGRNELISMRHNTPQDLIVNIVDSLPSIVCPWRLRARAHSRINSVAEQQQAPSSQAEVATASVVEIVSKVKKTPGLGGLGDSKWASPERASSTAWEAPPPPSQVEVITALGVVVVAEMKSASGLGGVGDPKWASSEKATSTAHKPQAKKGAGACAENGSVLDEIVKAKKLGGLADSKYASPEKKSPEKPTPVSSRGAGQSTPSGPRHPPRQSQASGGSNSGNAERGRPRVVNENISPFPPCRRKCGGFGMDVGDDESHSPLRRRSLSRSPSKSQSRSEKNVDDEVQGAAGNAFVASAVASPTRPPLFERTSLHHHRSGAVRVPVAEFGQMRLGAAAAPFLPPPPAPMPAMPAAFMPNSSQPLLLQGHAFITGGRGEVRRVRCGVRCGVRGSPWHDRATNTVMANIIVGDRIGRETEMIGALHGLPYDLQGNRWHADLFQAVEDLENEEDAAPIGPPRIDPDLEYSSQPAAAVYSWQSGLEEPSLPRFVPGPNDNFGSPPMQIYPSVVPPSYPRPPPELPQTYIYPVHPPAANNLAHFHPVIDRSQAVRAPREAFPELVNSMSGATLVAPAFPPANAQRRYTFGKPLMPNFQNHPGYQNAGVQMQDNPNQELFNHYVAQAQQPSPAQLSLQRMAELLGPPLQLTSRRPNVPEARSPNLPDGPPAPGTIFGNVPNSVSGRPDLAPEDAFDYQPPTPGDMARRSHFEGFDGVFRRLPRANAAIPIVDPNAPSASRPAPAPRSILKRIRGNEEEAKERRSGDEDEPKRG